MGVGGNGMPSYFGSCELAIFTADELHYRMWFEETKLKMRVEQVCNESNALQTEIYNEIDDLSKKLKNLRRFSSKKKE